jgi:hypothetical protein
MYGLYWIWGRVSGIKDPRFLDHEPFINLSRGIALISMI